MPFPGRSWEVAPPQIPEEHGGCRVLLLGAPCWRNRPAPALTEPVKEVSTSLQRVGCLYPMQRIKQTFHPVMNSGLFSFWKSTAYFTLWMHRRTGWFYMILPNAFPKSYPPRDEVVWQVVVVLLHKEKRGSNSFLDQNGWDSCPAPSSVVACLSPSVGRRRAAWNTRHFCSVYNIN